MVNKHLPFVLELSTFHVRVHVITSETVIFCDTACHSSSVQCSLIDLEVLKILVAVDEQEASSFIAVLGTHIFAHRMHHQIIELMYSFILVVSGYTERMSFSSVLVRFVRVFM